MGAAVGLEAYGKAPWQSNPESTPVATAVDDFAHVKLPALLSRKKEGEQSEPQAAANPVPAPAAEIPNREVLQASFEKISDILFDRAGSLAPEIDLGSPIAAKNTIRKFAQAIDQMPRELPQRYLLWDAIRAIAKDVDKPEGALKLNETVEAIAANKPVPQQPADTTWKWNFEPPKPVSNAPFSKTSANGRYYEVKAEAIPVIKSYLTLIDILLRVGGVTPPQQQLDSAREARVTLFNYGDALRKLDRDHPQIAAVRRIGDGLARSTKTEEIIQELREKFLVEKRRDTEYQAAAAQLSPQLKTILTTIAGGLKATGQEVPKQDLSTRASTFETLLRYQEVLRRAVPSSGHISLLGELSRGIWDEPKATVDRLKEILNTGEKPAPAANPAPPAPAAKPGAPAPAANPAAPAPAGKPAAPEPENENLSEPPVPDADIKEPPVPPKNSRTPAPRRGR